VDGSAVGNTEVVVGPLFASRNEPTGVHPEVGTRVDQELPFTGPIRNEEATCFCRADVPPVVSAPLVSSAGSRRRARYTFALGLRSGDDTSTGWMRCRLGRGILCLVGDSWGRGPDTWGWKNGRWS
jgi:hypothetical protein